MLCQINYYHTITQDMPKCVENILDNQLIYICSFYYYPFFRKPDYKSENSVFLSNIR